MASLSAVSLTSKKQRTGLQKQLESEDRICIVHCFNNPKDYGEIKPITLRRWETILKCKAQRCLAESHKDKQLLICERIPCEYDSEHHGFHEYCYNSFTNLKKARKRCVTENETVGNEGCSSRKRIKSTASTALLPVHCLFCEKTTKWVSVKKASKQRDNLVKCVTTTAEASIKEAVHRKADSKLKGLVENVDLIAREAWYHESCRKAYTRKEERHTPKYSSNEERTEAESRKSVQSAEEEAHLLAFQYLCKYVEEHIIERAHVIRMTTLTETYCNYMRTHSPQFYNQNYKTYKLKSKLINHFQSRIRFWQRYAGISDLVYSDEIPTGQAIGAAFENATSNERTVIEAAVIIRRAVQDGLNESQKPPWPPGDNDLRSEKVKLPDLLSKFLNFLYAKDGKPKSERCQLRVMSTGQDICYNVSKGKWKMPKHILLGMSVRHLSGNTQLINILNRHGHSVSHSFLLELETAICDSVQTYSGCLPPSIMPDNNLITQFCWDNFDLNEETPSGAGTTHSTHGIIIQEIKEQPYIPQTLPEIDKKKKRSISCANQQLEPCFINSKVEPNILTHTTSLNKNIDFKVEFSDFMWMLSRMEINEDCQSIPGWNGWLSKISDCDEQPSIVDYMEPLSQPITQNSTVQEVLKISQKASRAVGQQFTLVTFDLAVAKMAYSLVWQHKQLYSDVIIHLGVFHVICAYLKAIGKMMCGSGFEEIVIDSRICASGSIEKVMKGKHYNRSLRVHKAVLESLERLLFRAFQQHADFGPIIRKAKKELKEIVMNLCSDACEISDSNNSLQELAQKYFMFKEDVRQGKLGKTSQFWMFYMDTVWTVLQCLRATKTNDLDLHILCLEKMCPLFFSMDHPNYARFLTAYLLLLLNLDTSHPGGKELLKQKGFSVCRSTVPGSRNAVDMTIEQTINRQAKSKGGIVGFSQNVAAYHKWCITRHKRAGLVAVLLEETGLDSKDDSHKDNQMSQMKLTEKNVKRVVHSFESFTNPFDIVGYDKLISLSSGVEATEDVTKDILSIEKEGKELYKNFVQTRLIDKSESFHAPIKRNKKKTFAHLQSTVKVKTSKKNEVKITAQRNLFGQLLMLSQDNDLDIQKVMEYPLGPVPWALATPDGMPIKTNKAVLMQKLEDESALQIPAKERDHVHIIDGNALFHTLTNLPETFGELAYNIFCALPKVAKVHFLTDNYKEHSIKSLERMRRGESQVFIVRGSSTKLPREWRSFLRNDDNKKHFIQFLLNEWQQDAYAKLLLNREVIFACDNQCFVLSTADGETTDVRLLQDLSSSHEEADTLLILHSIYADQAMDSTNTDIIIRSPDTDVFLLLIAFCQKYTHPLYFDTGMGNKRKMIHIQTLCQKIEQDVQDSILGLHAFTGCDVNSAFVQKGKSKPLNILIKNPEFASVFKELGSSTTVSDELLAKLEKFVCQLYGKPSYSSTNKLRHDLVRQKYIVKGQGVLSSIQGFDISLLPPCRAALKFHSLRANYQTLIWKQADIAEPDLPDPEDHGWKKDANGVLGIHWCSDFVPQQLADILSKSQTTRQQESDNDDDIIQSDVDSDADSQDFSDSETSEEESV